MHTPASAAAAASAHLPAHSPFGGSVAARILGCPASYKLVAQVPDELRRPSDYADRGTALHAVMAHLLEAEILADVPPIETFIGKTFEGYTITADDIAPLQAAYQIAAALIETPGATYYLEQRVRFPGIDNAFGTADLIVRIGSTIYVVDFKFGSGVRVLALYPEGNEDLINSQLLYYGAAARASLREFFAGVDDIVLAIVQPSSAEGEIEPTSSVTVDNLVLDDFIEAFRQACDKALHDDTARPTRGPWCRFCPAKPICPAHTGPLIDLSRFKIPTMPKVSKEAYLQAIADGLVMADAVKDLIVTLRDQAKRALDAGEIVPGYVLTPGRNERSWRDEEATVAALTALGLTAQDIFAHELRSPAQIEKKAKGLNLTIPKDLIVSSRSGTSLTRAENAHAPVRGRGEMVQSVTAAAQAHKEKS